MSDETKEHCWHDSGARITNGMGTSGSDAVRCCHCGEYANRPFSALEQEVPPHGPYFSVAVLGYGVASVSGPCPSRP